MTLQDFFKQYNKLAIAFSGGVDSSYLLYAALEYGASVKAYYVKSSFQPEFEYKDALKLAKQLNADIKIINIDVLADDIVASNPKDRCYYCKKQIFSRILQEAYKDGFRIIADGSNASDDASDRPGMKALMEMKVLSPLRMCGLTKDRIRTLSKQANLFTWDKPAYACLATRVPNGVIIKEDILSATEICEEYLFSLGFSDFRIRYFEGAARIQIHKNQIDKLFSHREEIVKKLKEHYKAVFLDMEDLRG